MKSIVICTAFAFLSGCSVLAPQIDKSTRAAGKAVTFYCDNITSPDVRAEFRSKVNAAAKPNKIEVTCARDNVE